MAIILRNTKGSELTFTEVDDNFSTLLFDVALAGNSLLFYSNDGSNVLKTTVDLSGIVSSSLITQKSATPIVTSTGIMNFTGTGVSVSESPTGTAVVNISSGAGSSGTSGTDGSSGSSGTSGIDGSSGSSGSSGTEGSSGSSGTSGTEGSSGSSGASGTEGSSGSSGTGGDYTNATPTPINFPSDDDPNIPSGTTFSNKTFPEMMTLMLYPTLYPSLSNPTRTFSLSTTGLQIIGATIGTLTLSATFNRGTINPQYTAATPYRSGDPNQYNYGGTGVTNQTSTSLSNSTSTSSYVVILGNQSWTGAVQYDVGPQPKDSAGDDYDSPLSAGTTGTTTKTITGVYPAFATTVDLSTSTQNSLTVMTQYVQASVVTESGGGGLKQYVEIPDAWSTITGLQQYNTLSATWDTILLSTFTLTTITKTIESNTIDYNKYTHNGGTIGARQLRFIT